MLAQWNHRRSLDEIWVDNGKGLIVDYVQQQPIKQGLAPLEGSTHQKVEW